MGTFIISKQSIGRYAAGREMMNVPISLKGMA